MEIGMEDDTLTVRLKDGTEFLAPVIVSDAGARNTYLHLLPPTAAPEITARMKNFEEGVSSVTLFLGLKASPAALGVKGENYWLFDRESHDEIYARRNRLAEGEVGMAYVSFPSLKDPECTEHLAEVVALLDLAPFQRWASQPAKNRDQDYMALKKRISDAILKFVEQRIPGLSELVSHAELATPLSNVHYCAHPGGAAYGLPHTPARYAESWARPTTPIPGLFLTGADAMSHGIMGAMMGGVLGIGAIEGVRTLGKVMSQAAKPRAKGAGTSLSNAGPRAPAGMDTPASNPGASA